MINRELNYEELFNDMVNFTCHYIKKNNRKSAQLGVSGGIDSTVVSVLLYEVRKRLLNENYNFITEGYSLPTNTTNNSEFDVSVLVGKAFMSQFETHNIENITESIRIDLCISENSESYLFRRGNMKSRYRMMFLYDRARAKHGFVVGTDNYTEKLLGFSTIGGDALADYMPIQYFWKTEVYELAKYLLEKYKNEENWGAVKAIYESINLVPQDGLGISTSDMGQIGANNYFDVDEILYTFEKWSLGFNTFVISDEYKKLCEKFTQKVVDNVLNRRINNFKLKLPIEFKFM
jgi:NAD+ synthetase